jgi:hypothetical protein
MYIHLNALKPKIHLKLKKIISYLTENELRLHYKDQSVKAVYVQNRCLFREP